ncbi:MAG: hypothetical protein KC483_11180 [Nitrosarchaeum sp.]|nr:hypothetical protein [Nitrosarchaeum sp.]MCA9819702.1 hypothetical protein [Nitrosarchaeum sp.]
MSQSEFIKKIELAKTESERQVGKLFYDMGFTLEAIDSDIKDSNENKIGDVDLVCTFDDYVFLIEVNGEKKGLLL